MKILALETATEACSAALFVDGDIRFKYQVEPRKHSELILPMLEELLAEAGLALKQLDAVAFANGPGAFTGVRIATGVVQGVAYGADLPVITVSTLASLAQRAFREFGYREVMAAFDARMGEVYWGCYRVGSNGLVHSVIEDQIAVPESVEIPAEGSWYGVGTGWETYAELLSERLSERVLEIRSDLFCSAYDVAQLAAAVPPDQWRSADLALPTYLRDQVAKKPKSAL